MTAPTSRDPFGVFTVAAWLALAPASCSPWPCALGETECDGVCVRTSSDAQHCGGCGRTCGPPGATDSRCDLGRCRCGGSNVWCEALGACVPPSSYTQPRCEGRCRPPTTDCTTVCADLSSNPAHCGACGRSCGPNGACERGVCACRVATTLCGAACVDVENDPANCGRCGRACAAPTPLCRGGACVCPRGPSGEERSACGGECVDVYRDPAHCGMCGRACAPGDVCHLRACLAACPEGTTSCARSCRDTRSDRAHCGRCGDVCERVCSGGSCT